MRKRRCWWLAAAGGGLRQEIKEKKEVLQLWSSAGEKGEKGGAAVVQGRLVEKGEGIPKSLNYGRESRN